jgi:hypothetical protein
MSIVQCRSENFFDAELLETGARTDNISDRIERADLMKMHLVRRKPMDAPFRFGNTRKDAARVRFDKRGQRAFLEESPNLPITPALFMMRMVLIMMVVVVMSMVSMLSMFTVVISMVSMLVMVMVRVLLVLLMPMLFMRRSGMNTKMHARHLTAAALIEMHMKIAEPQLREFPLECRRIYPEITQRANGHVTADTGETIEKKSAHGKRGNELGTREDQRKAASSARLTVPS